MHLAAENGHADVISLLVEYDIGKTDREKEKTLWKEFHRTGEIDAANCYCFFMKDDDLNTPMHLAAINGHSSVVKILAEGGADVSARYEVDRIHANSSFTSLI